MCHCTKAAVEKHTRAEKDKEQKKWKDDRKPTKSDVKLFLVFRCHCSSCRVTNNPLRSWFRLSIGSCTFNPQATIKGCTMKESSKHDSLFLTVGCQQIDWEWYLPRKREQKEVVLATKHTSYMNREKEQRKPIKPSTIKMRIHLMSRSLSWVTYRRMYK